MNLTYTYFTANYVDVADFDIWVHVSFLTNLALERFNSIEYRIFSNLTYTYFAANYVYVADFFVRKNSIDLFIVSHVCTFVIRIKSYIKRIFIIDGLKENMFMDLVMKNRSLFFVAESNHFFDDLHKRNIWISWLGNSFTTYTLFFCDEKQCLERNA